MLYELLTGRRPFQSDDMLNLMQRIAESEVRPPRQLDHSIPRELERICLKALALRASDRYPTCSDFAEDLRYPAEQDAAPPQAASGLSSTERSQSDHKDQSIQKHPNAASASNVQPAFAAVAGHASSTPSPYTPFPTPTPTPTPTGPTRVIPRGLRSFDQSDADFFLELLPGPVDRMGLPDNIRFWKSRIETTDAEESFSVGLIYGPSGCGKSSLVKAGLMPRLSDTVLPIYIEATGDDTELRLARAIRKKIPALGGEGRLRDTLTTIRCGQGLSQGKSLLLVIDQFEQWLHAHDDYRNTELTAALRQCDGQQIRCIIMVRDDFWLSVSRFMRELEVDIESSNSRLVDLFDLDHAARVLGLFGRAFGKLPDSSSQWTKDQQDFVRQAVTGLAQDRKVVSVRLALFAEMMKSRDWTPSALKEVGGTEGVGTTFLEETFSSRTAPPQYRHHQAAARAVLAALLPDSTTDIKGQMRSQAELQEAAGYLNRPSDFRELLRILDSDLRLITPTDVLPDSPGEPDASASGFVRSRAVSSGFNATGSVENNPPADAGGSPTDHSPRYYLLTHDYLVPSLRDWLTRKQRETRTGRAELKLAERTALWTAKPENRHLPSLIEWMSIQWMTVPKKWTVLQSAMMRRARWVHGTRAALTFFGVCCLMATIIGLNQRADERRNQAEATRLVEGLLAANTAQVGNSLESLKPFRKWSVPQLQQEFEAASAVSDAKLHAALALAEGTQRPDPEIAQFLQQRLLTVTPAQLAPVLELLRPHKEQFIGEYWKVATDVQQPAARRFHAACALAVYDPESTSAERPPQSDSSAPYAQSGWKNAGFSSFVAEQLISVPPVYVGEYQELLRPVAQQLVPGLSELFKDPARGELARTLATSLLADYASSDPDTLTDLVIAADAVADKTLFPVLHQHQSTAVTKLNAILDERLEPDWKDGVLNPSWTEPSAAVRAQIEAARGLITERFAFCHDLPLNQFMHVAETLRASGYRPTRVRPWKILQGDATHSIAAIWTRDGRRWHVDPGLTKAELPAADAPAIKDGLLLSDVAAVPSSDGSAEPRFITLWSEPATDDEEHRLVLDVTESQLPAMEKSGFISRSTLVVNVDRSNVRRYTSIWTNKGDPSETRSAYAGFELVAQPQWDVAVAPAGRLPDILERFRQQLAQVDGLTAEKLDDPKVRESRATAHYQLGQLEEALADLDFLVDKQILSNSVLQYRTLTLARVGKAEEAKESLTKYLATDAPTSFKQYVQIQVPAALGDFEQASSQLESAVTAFGANNSDLYNIACAAALSSQFMATKEVGESQKFAKRTFEILTQLVAQGYRNAEQLKSDPDFTSLHADPRFIDILAQLEAPAEYAALWHANIEFESKLLAAVPIAIVAEQLRPLIAAGYRPFSIAVRPPDQPGPGGDNKETQASNIVTPAHAESSQMLCSVVLHRPLIPDADKESLAIRQAAAATALLRLNTPDKVWPLFQDQPDPRLRSYLLHRLATYGVDPQSLFAQLQQETETSRQRSLILGLGEFARAKLLSPEQTTAVTADLAKRCANDPDPGNHGAAEWTLRQLGAESAVSEVRSAFSTGAPIGDRRWYLTKTGSTTTPVSSLSFAMIDALDEFLMGSPISESERFRGSIGKEELRHRRQIGRRFAIGMHEITVAQFRTFRNNHNFDRTKAREEDSPANLITWYDSAAYCNWLSEQEGIPREQWCYDPEQAFEEGMSLLPDYLQRTGYRLLTEAEWEYACRAGTTTARYFGETEALLRYYAWYEKNSGERTLPVGTLKPNGFGLFDMQGNVLEWCQDSAKYYETDAEGMADIGRLERLKSSGPRVLRGGSFVGNASGVRSASRVNLQPAYRDLPLGFRVGRTLTPVPLTALLPAEAGKN